MMSFYHSQLQLIHSCIATSRGLSQKARKKREHSSLGITHFWQHLRLKQQKQEHMSCFLRTSQRLYVHVHFKCASKTQASINTSIPQWYLARAYTQELNSLFHVNIQRNIHKALQQQKQSKLQYLSSLVFKISL